MADVFESYDSYYVRTKISLFYVYCDRRKIIKYTEAVQDQFPLLTEKYCTASIRYCIYPMAYDYRHDGDQGTIHAKQQYVYKSIPWNTVLSIYGEIVDKYIKKNRKYIVQQVKVFDESGSLVTVSKATVILPG